MSKKVPTPKPVVIEQECSVCELDWDRHPDNPTIEDCIELLKTELTRNRTVTISSCDGHHHCHRGHCHCYQWHYDQWTWTGGTPIINVMDTTTDTTTVFRPMLTNGNTAVS